MDYITDFISSLHYTHWILQVLLVVIITIVVHKISKKFLKKLQQKFEKTKNIQDDIFIKSIRNSLSFFIVVIGLSVIFEIIHSQYGANILQKTADLLRDLGVIVAISWFAIRFIKKSKEAALVKKTKSKSKLKLDRATVDAVSKILNIVVIIVASLMTLQALGFKIGGILALGGVGGIAIGFAAKDLLSNFFGGLMIYFDRPFKVGDWIRSPDKEIEGTVVKIGWRQTQIKTFTHRPLYIPNSVFSSITIENPSRMTNRRIYETIGIRYDDVDKIEKIIKEVREMINKHQEIDQKQTIIVNLNSFAASSIDFFVYASTNTINWVEYHRIKQDVLLKVAKIISDNDAEIAFPTSTIHLAKNLDSNQEPTGL